jgi:predicted RNA binding protein YcfA (HicA-like mRNA interferase family)
VSPSLPVVSGAAVVEALENVGFSQVSQRGSHVKMRNSEGATVIIPLHRELARGTLSAILRQSGITISELIKFL